MLKAYMGVHEVVITIMMNYIATYLMKDLFLPYFGDPSKSGTQTYPMQPSARLTNLNTIKILNIPLGIIIFFMIGILAVLLYTFIIEKTKKGFEFRAVGLNRHAADYAGINSTKSIAISMVISGAFAGVGGAFYMIFTSTLATGGFAATSIGFDGLAAALLGGSTGLGTLISSLVLSYLEIVSLEIQYLLRVPKEVTGMITALVLFFIAMNKLFDNTWSKKPSRKKDISKKDGSEDDGLSSKNI